MIESYVNSQGFACVTENRSCVSVADTADMAPLINVMVLAFAGDPVARWMYRDPQRYLAYFGPFIQAFAGRAFSAGTAWRIDGNLGSALLLPPGIKPDEEAIAAILDESVSVDVMADVNAMFGEMAAYHPSNPHWYLPTIGVEPHLHRKGLGSALLAEALTRCDQEHVPAYLESSNSTNTSLYQKHGFEILGVIRAGDSPPMVPMLRGAR